MATANNRTASVVFMSPDSIPVSCVVRSSTMYNYCIHSSVFISKKWKYISVWLLSDAFNTATLLCYWWQWRWASLLSIAYCSIVMDNCTEWKQQPWLCAQLYYVTVSIYMYLVWNAADVKMLLVACFCFWSWIHNSFYTIDLICN